LLDFLKLLQQLGNGINHYNLDKKQIKELQRLKGLFFRLMPDPPGQVVK
jgi:hypothetical protein